MYQFGHIEAYARKPKKGFGVDAIWREAERVPGYCNHVENPQPHIQVYGSSPREAAEQATKWGNEAREKGGRRQLRIDAPVMLGGVLSYPRRGEEWDRFKKVALEWLKKKYGDRLLSVIEHQDEAHPHLHFYCVPGIGQPFNELHEGRKAAQEAKRKGEKYCIQKAANDRAMRRWQDELYSNVSREMGLMRYGPKRLRIPNRAEWQAHQTAMRAMLAAEKISQEAIAAAQERSRQEIATEKEQARQAIAAAKAKARENITTAKEQARQAIAKAQAQSREKIATATEQVNQKIAVANEKTMAANAAQAEIAANPPTSKLKEVNATLREQNLAFKEKNLAFQKTVNALTAALPESLLKELAKTMSKQQQQIVLAAIEAQSNGYSPS